MRQVRLDTPAQTQFHPVDPVDEYTKVSGLVDGDFTKTAWKDGVVTVPATFTIAEVGTTGEYAATLSFAEEGHWNIEIRLGGEYDQEWIEEFKVSRFLPDDAVQGRAL